VLKDTKCNLTELKVDPSAVKKEKKVRKPKAVKTEGGEDDEEFGPDSPAKKVGQKRTRVKAEIGDGDDDEAYESAPKKAKVSILDQLTKPAASSSSFPFLLPFVFLSFFLTFFSL
jgi:hypothetical protein